MGMPQDAARNRDRSTFVRIDKRGNWPIAMENVGIAGNFRVERDRWMLGHHRVRRRTQGGTDPAGRRYRERR